MGDASFERNSPLCTIAHRLREPAKLGLFYYSPIATAGAAAANNNELLHTKQHSYAYTRVYDLQRDMPITNKEAKARNKIDDNDKCKLSVSSHVSFRSL